MQKTYKQSNSRVDLLCMALLTCALTLSPDSINAQENTGAATANGACSVANSGSAEFLTINCGIGKDQGRRIIELLNGLLSTNDAGTINEKLDELLKIEKERPGLQPNHFYAEGVEYGSASSDRGPDIKSGTIYFENFRSLPGYEGKTLEYKYRNEILKMVCPSVNTASQGSAMSGGMSEETKVSAAGLTCRIVA